MNTQRRTVQLAIPQSDYALLRHLLHDNGWTIIDQDTEVSEAERYLHAEEMARKSLSYWVISSLRYFSNSAMAFCFA